MSTYFTVVTAFTVGAGFDAIVGAGEVEAIRVLVTMGALTRHGSQYTRRTTIRPQRSMQHDVVYVGQQATGAGAQHGSQAGAHTGVQHGSQHAVEQQRARR